MEQYLTNPYEQRILRKQNEEQYYPASDPPAWISAQDVTPDTLHWFDSSFDVNLSMMREGADCHVQFVTGLVARHITYFDPEVIVVAIDGQRMQGALENNAHAAAMMNNIHQHRYLGVIIGKDTKNLADLDWQFPCKMPKGQALWILDWFCPTMMWPVRTAEGSQSTTVWMVKMQKLGLEKQSWWSRREAAEAPER